MKNKVDIDKLKELGKFIPLHLIIITMIINV